MDARLKERLVGAAVLVAIGVLFIPWILDGPATPPASSGADLELPTEASSAPVRTQTIELEARPDAAQKHVVLDDADAAPSQTMTEENGAGVAAPVEPPAASLEPPIAPVIADPAVAATEIDTTTSSPAAGLAASVENTATQTDEPAQADALGNGQETLWTVQLGSFSDESNARRLAERVSSYGQSAEVSSHRAAGRQMFRVRVGPSKTRGEAELKASSLTAHGFVAQVVTAD